MRKTVRQASQAEQEIWRYNSIMIRVWIKAIKLWTIVASHVYRMYKKVLRERAGIG